MTTSPSYATPQTSFSTSDMATNFNNDEENRSNSSNQSSFRTAIGTFSKRNRINSGIHLQTLTTNENRSVQNDDDLQTDDNEQVLSSYYEHNRIKQERLLLISNIFRLLVVIILAPIIYFVV